jgi:hypothetical protein
MDIITVQVMHYLVIRVIIAQDVRVKLSFALLVWMAITCLVIYV